MREQKVVPFKSQGNVRFLIVCFFLEKPIRKRFGFVCENRRLYPLKVFLCYFARVTVKFPPNHLQNICETELKTTIGTPIPVSRRCWVNDLINHMVISTKLKAPQDDSTLVESHSCALGNNSQQLTDLCTGYRGQRSIVKCLAAGDQKCASQTPVKLGS